MDEALLTLVALVLGLAILLAPVLAIIALVRTGRRGQLARELDVLRREVRALQRVAQAQPPVPPLPPAAVVELAAPQIPSLTPTHPGGSIERARGYRESEPWFPAAAPAPEPAEPQRGATAFRPDVELERVPDLPAPAPSVNWERWIGVRGAALVGGAVFALAGILFFQYAIEQGWITPALRVGLGALTGLAAIAAGEWLRPRGYRFAPDAMVGAGIVVLYAACWAAHKLYGLVPFGVSFALMALVTAGCCLLALRRSSLIVAVLGLAGGFATPLLLSSGQDRPIGLFGYILLLDLGLLFVGRRRSWPLLGLLGVLGTTLIQALWVVRHLDPGEQGIGLVVLGVFALVFAIAGAGMPAGERLPWLASRASAVLLPFLFALYFASRADLGPHLWPTAALLALLVAAACVVARTPDAAFVPVGAAAGSIAHVALWLARCEPGPAPLWEGALVALALAGVFHAFCEWGARRASTRATSDGAALAAAGLLGAVALLGPSGYATPPWPRIVCGLALAALLVRQSALGERARLQLVGALGSAALLVRQLTAFLPSDGAAPAPLALCGAALAAAGLFQLVGPLRRGDEARRAAWHAAALVAAPLLPCFALGRIFEPLPLGLMLGAGLLAVLGVLHAAARVESAGWIWAVLALAVPVLASLVGPTRLDRATLWSALVGHAVLAALVALWPLAWRARFARKPLAFGAAALAAPLVFWPMRALVLDGLGARWVFALALVLGALPAAACLAVVRRWPAGAPDARTSALAAYAAAATHLGALVVALGFDVEWLAVALALWGAGAALAWVRIDHPALAYLSLTTSCAAFLKLVGSFAEPGHYAHQEQPIVNWLLYANGVPALAMLVAARALATPHTPRAFEQGLYRGGRFDGAAAVGVACVVTFFLCINLAILDAFATGATLSITLERQPARDLTTSIAWTLYALVLLGLGTVGAKSGLRWSSLAFLVLTLGKVFLHDLGELEGLYRVASLAGLALSLLSVSLLYQRFVFGKET